MKFSNDWFKQNIPTWDTLIPQYNPQRVLEVGSYEGQSISHLIQLMGNRHALEIYCLDTWEGGREHGEIDMNAVEATFDSNIMECVSGVSFPPRVVKMKGRSDVGLSHLIAEGKLGYFDMVYIDASHETPDVLADAVMAFRLLRVGGLMIFDDYLWGLGTSLDPLNTPKMGIDSFLNCYQHKIQPHPWLPNYQIYCRKLKD